MNKSLILTISIGSALMLQGCALGPDYVRPSTPSPTAFKETAGWKTAQPQTVDIGSKWWEAYGDPKLNELVEQANLANQNILIAEAQYRHASAIVDLSRAAYLPQVGASLADTRGRSVNSNLKLTNSQAASVSVSWEADIWGSIRRSVEADQANAQASSADLAAARLTIQAAVVQDYVQLRITDRQKTLFDDTIAAYEKSLRLTQSQFAAGVVMRSDVALADTTLKSAQAQAIDLDVQRTQLEHAIAVLTGKAPAEFSLERAPLALTLPMAPAGLPSTLLERRPDIAGAERRVAAANANIGVAKAAYFPSLILGAGASNPSIPQLLSSPPGLWSVGATLAGTLFDGGAHAAQNTQARADYDGAVAQYRQTVLNGFQEVEDDLAALRVLSQETVAQEAAVLSAKDAERITMAQYQAGTANFVAVTTAQTLALSNERTAVQLQGRLYAASVALIKAVGGGWNSAALAEAPTLHAQAKLN